MENPIAETSCLVPKRPGPNRLVPRCPGVEIFWCRKVLVPKSRTIDWTSDPHFKQFKQESSRSLYLHCFSSKERLLSSSKLYPWFVIRNNHIQRKFTKSGKIMAVMNDIIKMINHSLIWWEIDPPFHSVRNDRLRQRLTKNLHHLSCVTLTNDLFLQKKKMSKNIFVHISCSLFHELQYFHEFKIFLQKTSDRVLQWYPYQFLLMSLTNKMLSIHWRLCDKFTEELNAKGFTLLSLTVLEIWREMSVLLFYATLGLLK